MKKVVVIGAGISGLAAAFEIRQKAKAAGVEVEVSIIEKEPRPGGKMHTETTNGYLCEWGPNGYLDSKVHATQFCKRVGLAEEMVPASNVVNHRYLYAKGRLRVLPDSPVRFFLSNLLSIDGRLRIMMEPLIKPAPPDRDESVTQFATRRLGREALEMLLDPFVAGVFAGNPDTLSLTSCFSRIREMEQKYGSLVRALFALQKKRRKEKKRARKLSRTVAGATAPRGHLTSLKRGMSQLIEALARHFGDSLMLGREVSALTRQGGSFHLSSPHGEMDADAVVVATPAFQAAKILEQVTPGAAEPLRGIEYNSLWMVTMGFDERALARPLDGYGFLIPRREKRSILGCLWSSSIFPGRAPAGKVLLTVMAGGARSPEIAALPRDEIVHLAREEMRVILGITAEPEFLRTKHHAKAIPQYTIGHALRLASLDDAVSRVDGLFLTGNAYRGIAMADCILQAGITARKVLAFLGQKPR